MDRIIHFTVFCLENYKQVHNMTGKDALAIFDENEVFDYIKKFYDILHMTGDGYIVKDIDRYIESRVN
ncbi:DUF3791 domain-containing protein [Vallitalea sp.]|jgi:hypothetical protein|uniref:DUF3791 domain-containing protein n=1 Tax=Vallitalea sp. TaxID=1882829 RepID=UPI0025E8819F|nr:DUF3791 domain-containing protein [Vallitalea sp.]MCT4687109.1 DUF3791 domain-containing protein [Vallitalea sp.]